MTTPLEFMRTIWAVDHALNGLSRTMESRLGVTGPQRLVLRLVGRTPGISAGAVASALHLNPSTLTGHLRRLEDKGLLKRKPSSLDKRKVELVLTARGTRLDVATPGTVESACSDVTRACSAADLARTQQVLEKLTQALAKQTALVSKPTRATVPRTNRRNSR